MRLRREPCKNAGQRLDEIENPKRYLIFEGQSLEQRVICIHCGKDYFLGQAIIDIDDLVKCADPDCNGSLIDLMRIEENETVEMRRKAYGFDK